MQYDFPEINEEEGILKKVPMLNVSVEEFDEACARNLPTHIAAIEQSRHTEMAVEFAPLEFGEGRPRRGIRAIVKGKNILVTALLDEPASFAPADQQARQIAAQFAHHCDKANIVAALMGR